MARPVVHLKTPRPSIEELVKGLGLSKARQRRLNAIVQDALSRDGAIEEEFGGELKAGKSRKLAAAA